MNKSKFLKKSLAAVLSVLLIVAMIPLSASASQTELPALTRIYVDDKEITANGTQFSANYAEDQHEIELSATLPNGTLLYAFTAPNDESLIGKPITDVNAELDIDDYENGVVYLKLVDDTNTSHLNRPAVWYTLNLTQVQLSDETGLTAVSVTTDGKNRGLLNATIDDSDPQNPVINVEAAYGWKAEAATTITVTPIAGASVEGGNTIQITDDEVNFTLRGGNIHKVWTVKVTEAPALLDFSVAGVSGVFSDADGDGKDDTITVTLDRSAIQNTYGEDIDNPKLLVEFSAIARTTIQDTTGSTADVTSGSKPEFTGLAAGLKDDGDVKHTAMKTLTVKCGSASDGFDYNLKVIVPASNDTTISYAAIDKVEAEIDGNNIYATLDASTTNDAKVIRLHVPKGAEVSPGDVTTPTANSTDDDWTVTTTESSSYDVWETNVSKTASVAKTNATADSKKTFTVTAADKSYSTQYSIWWTKAKGQTEAKLTAFNLKKGDTVVTGKISENDHTVTVEMPYMTTSLENWVIIPAYSAGARGTYHADTAASDDTDWHPIMRNISKITSNVDITTSTNADVQTLENFVKVHSQGTDPVTSTYDLVVKFKKPANGKLLTGMTVTVQDAEDSDGNARTNKAIYRAMDDDNTPTVSIKNPTYKNTGATDKLGEIKVTTAYSQANPDDGSLVMPIVSLTTNGGVAFGCRTDVDETTIYLYGALSKLDGTSDDEFASNNVAVAGVNDLYNTNENNMTWGTSDEFKASNNLYVAVLPEQIAKVYLPLVAAGGGYATIGSGAGTTANDINNISFYKVVLDRAAPVQQGTLNTLKIAGVNMRVTTGTTEDSVTHLKEGTIFGTLPFSATVETLTGMSATDCVDAAQFLEFTTSKYAKFGDTDATNGPTYTFANKGDKTGDGEEDGIGTDNAKILFVRKADHKVDAYVMGSSAAPTSSEKITNISVYAEAHDGASAPTNTYKLTELKYADPCAEAAIKSFALGDYTGTVNESAKTISVTVPQGTNLKAMKATYTASTGATVSLDDDFATKITSGKTAINASTDLEIFVRSEDEKATEKYTIKVTIGEIFIDVNKGDWFYDYVVTAALNEWIQGTSSNTFSPYNTMTRGQFATIIARIDLGADALKDYTGESSFADVPSTSAYSQGIAYCADMNYINGVGNNNFAPSSPITREQAATILCRVKGINPISGTTDYADDASIAEWAKGYVKAATAEKIFEGDGTNFNPKRNLKRCEGAKILVVSANK